MVQLRIPDHLAEGPRSAEDLATLTAVEPDALLRLLRAATALDVCTENAEQYFALTDVGEAMRTDAPRHAAAAILQLGNGPIWAAVGDIRHCVTTGQPALERAGGVPLFSQLSADHAARVSEAMLAYYGDEPGAVAAAYDFSGVGTLVDVGGSSGNLLTTLLEAMPDMRGVLFDLPGLALPAARLIEARGLANRCRFVGGDFFDHVPGGGDAYLLSHVLNDWPIDRCLAVLRNVRRVMPHHGRVLIIEELISPTHESDRAKLLDLISLTVSGGRHRSAGEHGELLAAAGFQQTRVIPTSIHPSVIEGRPV
jgi:hypothetical protein